MIIHRVKPTNWCQYRHADFAFGPMTAIVGPNGSGKTTLIAAIIYALTGEIRLPGVKKDNVRHDAGDADAGVLLEFTHGERCEVYRSLQGKRSYLKVGDETLTKIPEIDARLRKILGIEQQLLMDYVFVDQWEMFAFISQKNETRAKAFAKMFGLEKAEKIWDELRDVKLPEARVSIDGQAVKASLAGAVAELGELAAELQTFDNELTIAESMQPVWEKTLKEAERRPWAVHNLEAATELLANAQLAATTANERLIQAAHDRLAAAAKMDNLRIEVAAATELKKQWAVYTSNEAVAESCRRELEAALNTAQLASEVFRDLYSHPVGYLAKDDRELAMASLAVDHNNAAVVDAFLASAAGIAGRAACPTCGTPTDNPSVLERFEQARQVQPVLRKRIADLQAAINLSDHYDARYSSLEERLRQANERLQQCRDRTALMPAAVKPAQPLEAAAVVVQAFNTLTQELDKLTGYEREAGEQAAKALGAVASLTANRDSFVAEMLALPEHTEAAVLEAKAGEAKLAKLAGDKASLAERLQQARQVKTSAETMLQKFEAETARYWKVRQATEFLGEIRDLFHRDNLPARISQHYLDSIQDGINDSLARFDSDFRVTDSAGLKLTLAKADGRLEKAERLSGGQKVLLALGFRPTVNSIFGADIGLLCLDEPTVGLDSDNIQCVRKAVEKLREVGGLQQLILITHESGLETLCDTTIQLPITEGA